MKTSAAASASGPPKKVVKFRTPTAAVSTKKTAGKSKNAAISRSNTKSAASSVSSAASGAWSASGAPVSAVPAPTNASDSSNKVEPSSDDPVTRPVVEPKSTLNNEVEINEGLNTNGRSRSSVSRDVTVSEGNLANARDSINRASSPGGVGSPIDSQAGDNGNSAELPGSGSKTPSSEADVPGNLVTGTGDKVGGPPGTESEVLIRSGGNPANKTGVSTNAQESELSPDLAQATPKKDEKQSTLDSLVEKVKSTSPLRMAGIFAVPSGMFLLNWFCFKRQVTQQSIGCIPYGYLGPIAIGTAVVSIIGWKGYTLFRGYPEPEEAVNSDSAEKRKIRQRRAKMKKRKRKKRAKERSLRAKKKAREDQAMMTNYAIGGAAVVLLLLLCCCLCGDDDHEDEWDIENPEPRGYRR